MLFAEQIRAARGLLDWTQRELADQAGVSLSTVKRMEAGAGPAQGHGRNIWALQETLEKAGIRFLGPGEADAGPGVCLKARTERDA